MIRKSRSQQYSRNEMAEQARTSQRPARGRLVIFGAATVALSVLLAWWLGEAVRRSAMDDLEAQGRQRLGLYLSSFRNHLEKHEYLPAVLARDRDVQTMLRSPDDPLLVDNVNERLAHLNSAARTSVLYVMDPSGLTRAASNWTESTSFVGQNYGFRPYFKQALAEDRGRYFAIGVTTGMPAFFFAGAVHDPDGVSGVAVVRLDIEPLQRSWEEAGETVLLADEFGIVFLSSRPNWRFTSLQPLSSETRKVLEETRKYGGIDIRPLSLAETSQWRGRALVESGGRRYLRGEQLLSAYGWKVIYLSDVSTAEIQGRQAAFAALACCALLALTILFLRQYRQRQQARDAMAETVRRARDELEIRVAERTKDLQKQVLERERTERVLREAQDELVQAGKLAALGQMSAAIAHEINQPLTAIHTFAAASKLYLERGDTANVAANLSMIEDLTRRMAEITRHLKSFARKSAADRKSVSLRQVVNHALTLLESRLRLEEVSVKAEVPDDAIVLAEEVRLEQVFINLMRNACDAMSESKVRQLEIIAKPEAGGWAVRIADSGLGISPENMQHLFDPFFTTKQAGEGLGLGLAISHGIIRDFGGNLVAGTVGGGGAAFTLWLPAAASAVEFARSGSAR